MLAQLSRIWLSGTREPVIGTLKYDAMRKLWKTLSARMLLITENALTARIRQSQSLIPSLCTARPAS